MNLILLLALIVAATADTWTTHRALSLGAVEANPVVRWMIDKCGKAWPLVKALPIIPLCVMLWYYPGESRVILAGCVVGILYAWVAAHNLALIRRLDHA